jgi:hypothetical protein
LLVDARHVGPGILIGPTDDRQNRPRPTFHKQRAEVAMIAIGPRRLFTHSTPRPDLRASTVAPHAFEEWRDEDSPYLPNDEPEEPSDLDNPDVLLPFNEADWEVFLPDDLPFDPTPEPGDFWIDPEVE